jgi:hypothetical protein
VLISTLIMNTHASVSHSQKRHIVLSVAASHSHAMVLALETKPHSLPSQMASRWQTVSQAHTGLGECAHNTLVVAALYTACKCNRCAPVLHVIPLSSFVSA